MIQQIFKKSGAQLDRASRNTKITISANIKGWKSTQKNMQLGNREMIRQYSNEDIDEVMQIWLDGNIQAHCFIPSDYWHTNYEMVREMLPHAEIYVHEDEATKKIGGFIGLNDDHIEGIFVREAMRSRGIGKQLLDCAKEIKPSLKLNAYQNNKRAIDFYLREGFNIQSENLDSNTGEKEFIMIWNR